MVRRGTFTSLGFMSTYSGDHLHHTRNVYLPIFDITHIYYNLLTVISPYVQVHIVLCIIYIICIYTIQETRFILV